MLEDTTMTRRLIRLILTLALSLLVAPLAAKAQPTGQVYRIGYLATAPPTRPGVGCAPRRAA
jgi:hypothetical protein